MSEQSPAPGNMPPAPSERPELLDGITESLDKLEPVDPELIGALKQAREAGVVIANLFSENITGEAGQSEPEGAGLSLTDLSRYPEPMKASDGAYGNGILQISAHEWVTNDRGERTVVSGVISMDAKGKLIPTTELMYPTEPDEAPTPGRQDNVVRTVRPYRGRKMVHEEHRGEGDPLKIRAMAINAARKIAGQDQAPEAGDGPEAVAA